MSCAALLLLSALPAEGQATPAEAHAPEQTGSTPGGGLVLFPPEHLYEPYLADPITPRFGLGALYVTDVGIADSGAPRFGLELGGRFGLLRWGSTPRPWQMEIEAGFRGWFDIDHSEDNIGWDGIYGLALSHRLGPAWRLKLAVRHISSHLGDEFEERTGRRRIGYTREEAQVGLSWRPSERWRLYAEGAYAYGRSNQELQRPGRVQAGVEHLADTALWRGQMGWYAAVNADAMEERGWEPDLAAQLGLTVPSGGRRWRLGLGYASGRVPLGELFQDEESYWSMGLYLDL